MWLAASMNLIRVGYRCGGRATSVDITMKLIAASLLLVWYFFNGTWNFGAIGSTLRFGGVLFYTLRTRGVNSYTLGNWLPCCGRWVSGGCTAHLNISDSFLCQLVQVVQLLMVMPVLGFLGQGSILILQLLMNLLSRFLSCQIGEGRDQLCLKFYWLWYLSCNIWIIFSVTVLLQYTIHMIQEKHMLIYSQACYVPWFLFLMLKIVCNWSWRYQRVVHEWIDFY